MLRVRVCACARVHVCSCATAPATFPRGPDPVWSLGEVSGLRLGHGLLQPVSGERGVLMRSGCSESAITRADTSLHRCFVSPDPVHCGRNGWCGSTEEYCGNGCQTLYGAPCWSPSSTPTASLTRTSSPTPTPSAAVGRSVSAVRSQTPAHVCAPLTRWPGVWLRWSACKPDRHVSLLSSECPVCDHGSCALARLLCSCPCPHPWT